MGAFIRYLTFNERKGHRIHILIFALMGLILEGIPIKTEHNELNNVESNMRLRPYTSGLLKIGLIFAFCSILVSALIKPTDASPISVLYYNDYKHRISTLDLLRYLWQIQRIQDHMDRVAVTTPPSPYKRGGSNCMFNAGLAHNCDYRDVIASVSDMGHWGSALSPGRRRKK